jgi:urease subunit gamma/beta
VHLTPQERDRLLIATAAMVARGRLARGLRLNAPETIAVIAETAIEAAREGVRLAEAVARARAVLGPDDVLPGVSDIVTEVRVEAVFDDGTRLVVVPDPVGWGRVGGGPEPDGGPGAVLTAPVSAAAGETRSDAVQVEVVNTSAVPISVTSHWHFFEANPRLRFDRAAAYGRHLAVPAGATVRFDPGVPVPVELVPIGGGRVAVGFAGLVDGPLDDPAVRADALRRVVELGYATTGSADDTGLT